MSDVKSFKLDFYYGNQAEQFSFYRIPKLLFTDKRFSCVSAEAKILYGLLLDRMSLSIKNGWVDQENRVYIYFKLEEVMEYLNVGKDKGVKLFAELDTKKGCGLIQRKQQGLGKPVIIYVMNFTSEKDDAPENTYIDAGETNGFQPPENATSIAEALTSEKPKSRVRETQNFGLLKKRSLDFGNSEPNHTEYNNININDTELNPSYPIQSHYVKEKGRGTMDEMAERQQYRRQILENIDYDCLLNRNYDREEVDGLVDLMLDAVCSKQEHIVVSGEVMLQEVVKARMLKVRCEHIEYVLDSLRKNTTKIHNIKSYLLASLYNATMTLVSYYTAEVNHDLFREGKGET